MTTIEAMTIIRRMLNTSEKYPPYPELLSKEREALRVALKWMPHTAPRQQGDQVGRQLWADIYRCAFLDGKNDDLARRFADRALHYYREAFPDGT